MVFLAEEEQVVLTLEPEHFQPSECWVPRGKGIFHLQQCAQAPHARIKPSFQGGVLAALAAGSTKPELP